MGLSRADSAIIEKARTAGNAGLAEELDDATCAYLLAVIVADLNLKIRTKLGTVEPFFSQHPETQRRPDLNFEALLEEVVARDRDVVTYFACLAKLHKARLKYARILERQAIPTMDQVGPRGLLQFGSMSPRALTGCGANTTDSRVVLNGHDISSYVFELNLIINRSGTTLNLKLAVPVTVQSNDGFAMSRVFNTDGSCITVEELAEAVAAFDAVKDDAGR